MFCRSGSGAVCRSPCRIRTTRSRRGVRLRPSLVVENLLTAATTQISPGRPRRTRPARASGACSSASRGCTYRPPLPPARQARAVSRMLDETNKWLSSCSLLCSRAGASRSSCLRPPARRSRPHQQESTTAAVAAATMTRQRSSQCCRSTPTFTSSSSAVRPFLSLRGQSVPVTDESFLPQTTDFTSQSRSSL